MSALFLIDKVQENRNAFARKVVEISQYLGINPNWLMLIMYHESGLDHRRANGMGCIGLIQFCPNGGLTASGLTAYQMANMTNVEQLEYVKRYFAPKKGEYKSFFDLYTYAFYPVAFGKYNRSWRYGSEISDSYARSVKSWNPAFDINADGYVSIGDFEGYLNKFLKQMNAPFSLFEKPRLFGVDIPFVSFSGTNKYSVFLALLLAFVVVYFIFVPKEKRLII